MKLKIRNTFKVPNGIYIETRKAPTITQDGFRAKHFHSEPPARWFKSTTKPWAFTQLYISVVLSTKQKDGVRWSQRLFLVLICIQSCEFVNYLSSGIIPITTSKNVWLLTIKIVLLDVVQFIRHLLFMETPWRAINSRHHIMTSTFSLYNLWVLWFT